METAIHAKALGWDVILGEKAEVLGDTTALSGGALCTRSAHQRQQLNLINIYLTSNLAKPPSTSERLREFLEGKAAPLNVPGAKNAG